MSELSDNAFEANAVALTSGPLLIGGDELPWNAVIGEDQLPADDVPVGTIYFRTNGETYVKRNTTFSGSDSWAATSQPVDICNKDGVLNSVGSLRSAIRVDEDATEAVLSVRMLPSGSDPDRRWYIERLEMVNVRNEEMTWQIFINGNTQRSNFENLDPSGVTSQLQVSLDDGDYIVAGTGELVYTGYYGRGQPSREFDALSCRAYLPNEEVRIVYSTLDNRADMAVALLVREVFQ